MSSSSAHSSSSSHSGSSHSDTLLQLENVIEKHPKDTLPHSADALPHLVDVPSSHEDTEPENSPIPPRNRSAGRDVHIFNASDRSTSIGGLILTNGITNANLHAMTEIFVILEAEYILRNESDIIIEKDDSTLLPGNYYID